MKLSKELYSREAIGIAAHIFSNRAEVYLSDGGKAWELSLKAKRAKQDPKALEGEFKNELLNQEYRFIVSRFNAKLSKLIVTQALFSARGEERTPEAPSAELKAETERLLAEARDEIARTMPKKLPPQGAVLPPAPEDLV